MKKYLLPLLIISGFIIACNNEDKKATEEKDTSGLMDATRNFIRAALDGKFEEAKKFMLIDSSNVHYLENAEENYNKLDTLSKESYAASSIIIHSKDEKIKDSLAVVIYSNSYKNNPDTLRVLKQNNQWLVDLKYLYEHDYDTLMQHIPKDTLR
jgi:hypothetical protein